jgi:hypothetical protein
MVVLSRGYFEEDVHEEEASAEEVAAAVQEIGGEVKLVVA